MKCTSCGIGELVPAYLDNLFPCSSCTHCGGNLIFLADYLRWMENNTDLAKLNVNSASDADSDEATVVAEETSKAMLCPKTSTLMLKYKITKDSEHKLDLSPSINAIWLDKGEWQLLVSKGLAGKLNEIFTDNWQRKIREAKTADTMEAMYEREFGDSYTEIKAFRELIHTMKNKPEVIAYLVSDDPYSV